MLIFFNACQKQNGWMRLSCASVTMIFPQPEPYVHSCITVTQVPTFNGTETGIGLIEGCPVYLVTLLFSCTVVVVVVVLGCFSWEMLIKFPCGSTMTFKNLYPSPAWEVGLDAFCEHGRTSASVWAAPFSLFPAFILRVHLPGARNPAVFVVSSQLQSPSPSGVSHTLARWRLVRLRSATGEAHCSHIPGNPDLVPLDQSGRILRRPEAQPC